MVYSHGLRNEPAEILSVIVASSYLLKNRAKNRVGTNTGYLCLVVVGIYANDIFVGCSFGLKLDIHHTKAVHVYVLPVIEKLENQEQGRKGVRRCDRISQILGNHYDRQETGSRSTCTNQKSERLNKCVMRKSWVGFTAWSSIPVRSVTTVELSSPEPRLKPSSRPRCPLS